MWYSQEQKFFLSLYLTHQSSTWHMIKNQLNVLPHTWVRRGGLQGLGWVGRPGAARGGRSHPGKLRGTLECEPPEGGRRCHLAEVAQNVLYLKLEQRHPQSQSSGEESEKKVWQCCGTDRKNNKTTGTKEDMILGELLPFSKPKHQVNKNKRTILALSHI